MQHQKSRRRFLQRSVAVGAAGVAAPGLLLSRRAQAQAALPVLLDAAAQPKFVVPLPNPLAPTFNFLPTRTVADPNGPLRRIPAFDLQMTQFNAQLGLVNPATGRRLTTTLWGYGTALQAPTFPGRTFQVPTGTRVQVRYDNRLAQRNGTPLRHLFPLDTTLDWANPGNLGALAPVPLVAHLHGGDSQYRSDGLPDAWETPNESFRGALWDKPYIYDNAQEAGHLWYHDHALGVTRQNVYAGLAGNYFIRGADELRLIATNQLPAYPYEVPLAIQDRQFLANGQLYYPSDPSLYPFDGATPTLPLPPATHLPEFFGDVMLVNGAPWPRLDVEPRQYRLRLLNGSDSRVYELRVETGTVPTAGQPAPMHVIGNELGLLNAPVPVSVLRLAPGERYDVIVDFSAEAGKVFTLTNTANAPYPDADPPVPGITDQIMQFRVNQPLRGRRTTLPANLRPVTGALPAPDPAAATVTRRILLVEGTDQFGRLMTMMGPLDRVPTGFGGASVQGTLFYTDPVTETPALGSTEIWEFYNTTVDAHPIHMHLVDFRVLNRQAFTIGGGDPNANLTPKDMGGGFTGGIVPGGIADIGFAEAPVPAAPWEAGKKDTAVMFPGQVTRVLASFRRPGPYVYHCHILSHEDHEMMRPYEVKA